MTDSAKAVTVRRATAGDLRAIGELGALLVRAHHELDPQRFIPATSRTAEGYAHFLGTQLNESKVVIFVAELAGAVVGYTYAGLEGQDWMALRGPSGALYDIVVTPAQRGKRIAKLLLEATMAELRAKGAPRAVLSTAQGNVEAQRLFEAAGFRRTMVEMTLEL